MVSCIESIYLGPVAPVLRHRVANIDLEHECKHTVTSPARVAHVSAQLLSEIFTNFPSCMHNQSTHYVLLFMLPTDIYYSFVPLKTVCSLIIY